jgi:glycosyltransferase involved in cell wall biosynthesis
MLNGPTTDSETSPRRPPAAGERHLSIVVPIYNEVESIPQLHAEISQMLTAEPYASELIYVDDRSGDGSWELLQSLATSPTNTERIRVIALRLRRNYGQTAAMSAGFRAATGSVVVPMDGDGQNNPADVPRLVARLEEGFDVVSGWRKNRQDKAVSRKLPSMVANRLIGRLSGVRLNDYGCTLKAYRGSLLKELRLYGEMHRFIPLYLARLGARVTELAVDHRARAHGVSKYGSRRIFKVFLDLFLIRFMSRYSTRPLHFFGKTALLFCAGFAATCVSMIVFKYGWLRLVRIDYQASFVQTPLPSLAGTFLVAATLSIFFGILAELLVRVLYESQDQVPFAVSESVSSSVPLRPVR